MQMGYVARPDCFRTFGLLGAVSSCSTLHFGSPVPVFVAVHPGGGAPASRLSKLIVSADMTTASTGTAYVTRAHAFISIPHLGAFCRLSSNCLTCATIASRIGAYP